MDVGPAQQLLEFAEPLIDDDNDNPEHLDRALGLATLFWTLALNDDELERRRQIVEIAEDLSPATESTRCDFRHMAHIMVGRHRTMFPELH